MNAHEFPPDCVPTLPVPQAQCGCGDDLEDCDESVPPALIVTPTPAPVYITGGTYHCVTSKRFVIVHLKAYKHKKTPV